MTHLPECSIQRRHYLTELHSHKESISSSVPSNTNSKLISIGICLVIGLVILL